MGPMILAGVIIKAYTAMTFLTVANEIWNIKNPRPFPKQIFYTMQWEEQDFIKMKNGSYVLRKQRKVDNQTKAQARRLWHERKAKRIR